MIDADTIVATLGPINGKFFSIADLSAFAAKITTRGNSIERIIDGQLVSYVLYYENNTEFFVSMVWTNWQHTGRGHATCLLRELAQRARAANKGIRLEVHSDNPAIDIYRSLGYLERSSNGSKVTMERPPRVAIMQPYVFPYLGYFHLVEASDTFVFYDDVNHIRRGWVNRNNIVVQGAPHRFTVPLAGASQNMLIRDVKAAVDSRWLDKFRSTMDQAYAHAAHRVAVRDLVLSVLERPYDGIADLAMNSIASVYEYLDRPFRFSTSTAVSPHTEGLDRTVRLATIARDLGYRAYVNAPGGRSLYTKAEFARHGVDLNFVESEAVAYDQGAPGAPFVPGMSIIDVLMHNSPARVIQLLSRFRYQ